MGGLDKKPHFKTATKGEIWKGTYHNGRALMNCITMLANEGSVLYKSNHGFRLKKKEWNVFIEHWQCVAKKL